MKLAMAAMANPGTAAVDLAEHLQITATTLCTYVNSDGAVKAAGQRVLDGTRGVPEAS